MSHALKRAGHDQLWPVVAVVLMLVLLAFALNTPHDPPFRNSPVFKSEPTCPVAPDEAIVPPQLATTQTPSVAESGKQATAPATETVGPVDIVAQIAEGRILHVDNRSKAVWINLGNADGLKPRVRFSVCANEVHGIVRRTEEIKGKIEVTRILDSHLAEARIVKEDQVYPIVANDVIFSPESIPEKKKVRSSTELISMPT